MSVSSSIDLKLINNRAKPLQIIQALNNDGWKFDFEGKKEYTPLGDIDEFNWQCEEITDKELFEILLKKQEYNEPLGLVMIWGDSQTGGSFHFWSESSISIILNINRKTIYGNTTDVNWYFSKILMTFKRLDIIIETLNFSEHL